MDFTLTLLSRTIWKPNGIHCWMKRLRMCLSCAMNICESWWQTRGGGEWPAAQWRWSLPGRPADWWASPPILHADHQGRPSLLLVGSIEISDYLDLLVRPADLNRSLKNLCPALIHCHCLSGKPWICTTCRNDLQPYRPWRPPHSCTRRNYQVERLQHSPYIPLPGIGKLICVGSIKSSVMRSAERCAGPRKSGVPMRWYMLQDPHKVDEETDACWT